MRPDRCEKCTWFDEMDSRSGYCHRYPPMIALGQGKRDVAFPPVLHEDWCGEFRKGPWK